MTNPHSPLEVMTLFAQYVSERALDALVSLYEPGALFVPAPGVAHAGHASIRAALAEMLELAPSLETKVLEVHQSNGTALVIVDWSLCGTLPDGTAVNQTGRSADVLRQQSDGTWRVLIDHP